MQEGSRALDGAAPGGVNAGMSGDEQSANAATPVTNDDLVQRYLANLAWLYRDDPELAVRIEAIPFGALPPMERARDGFLTVRVTTDDGREAYAHSRYRPVEEARTLVEAQPESETPAFVLGGIGLGYHLAELERRYDSPLIVVAEDDLTLIKAALCTVDVSEALKRHRLIFITAADRALVHNRLERVNTDLLLGVQFLVPPLATRYHKEFQNAIRALVTDYVAYGRMQLVTLLRIARVTTKNVAFNMPTYLGVPGIEVLKDRARGYPAIIVAAGPSLARNIERLRYWRERAVVIAVQTVFKNLLARGIPPHFVTSLDFHEVSAQFFEGVEDVGGAILVAEPKATWHVLDAYPGRKHVLHHPLVANLLHERAPRRDSLKGGTTVAHLCFYLAEHLGCDPIMFVGQDLSFSDGVYYSPGMPIERIWQPELGRFNTVEMRQWERVRRSGASLRAVEDVHGRLAYVDEQMSIYAEQFETDFSQSDRHIVHACEGGRRLAGMEVMTLDAAGERYCTRPLPPDLFAMPSDVSSGDPGRERVIDALEERLDEVLKMKAIAVETTEKLEQLSGLLSKPAEFNRIIARVDELRTMIQQYDRTYRVVVGISQAAELRRYAADRRMGTVERETAETAKRRLARDREFVEAFTEGCTYMENLLPLVIGRVRERMS
ncbi:MAG: motility associated factor glycosyltransferase family protein [Phycisphaerae bacterium]|nr:motility associated factor glycosyltransferase family protein [Phycisphaerae bacterium]